MVTLTQAAVGVILLAAIGLAITAPIAATVWLVNLLARNGFLPRERWLRRSARRRRQP